MKFSKEDIELIEKFIEIKNKGYYVSGEQLTEVYNRVLERNVPTTNCGSCLRQRVNELETALNQHKIALKRQEEIKSQEALKEEEVKDITPEENNKPTEPKRVGRPKKS